MSDADPHRGVGASDIITGLHQRAPTVMHPVIETNRRLSGAEPADMQIQIPFHVC